MSSNVTTGWRAVVKAVRTHGFDLYQGRIVALDVYGMPYRVVYQTSAWSEEGVTVQLQRRMALLVRQHGEFVADVLTSEDRSADKRTSA